MRHVEESKKTKGGGGEGRGGEKKGERVGRKKDPRYMVGGYLRRKRHEQQIDGRPPGPEWVLLGPRTSDNLPPVLALAISFPVAPHCPAKKCHRPA